MVKPIINTGNIKAVSSINISEKLVNQAKFKGYKVKIVTGLSESSYHLFWAQALGDKINERHREGIQKDTNSRFYDYRLAQRVNTTIIELSDVKNQLVGYSCLSQDQTTGVVELSKLAVSRLDQGEGLGRFLMDCSCEITKNKGANFIVFDPIYPARGFYKKYADITFTQYGSWRIDIPVSKVSVNEISSYLNVEMSEKYKTKAIPNLLFDLF